MTINTTNLTLDTADGPAAAYLATPSDGGPGVLVLHAWWGLNADFRGWCDELAEAGFTALAPDLRAGQVVDTVEAADALRHEFSMEQLVPVVEAARDALLERATGDTLGVVGASMGAAWAFWLAETDADRVRAVVAYYGIAEAEWSGVRARVLHHFGDRDHLDPVDDAQAMHRDLTAAGVEERLEVHSGADHWFAEPSRPEYDATSAERAWQQTVDFLQA